MNLTHLFNWFNTGVNWCKQRAYGLTALLLVLVGAMLVLTQSLQELWHLWLTDALRSIGMAIPVAAAYFAWREGRELSWRDGQWWGLLLMLLPLWLQGSMGQPLTLMIPVHGMLFNLAITSPGVLWLLYFSGACVYFGGMRAWCTLKFPLWLLLLVNPVPHAVDRLDISLQIIAATVARAFAGLIHVPVEEGLLRMMFAPNLGIFIAPGCDGMRGMAAMLVISLLAGRYYGLRPLGHLGFVIGAVLAGYVLNLVRLCLVVVYYRIALAWPSLGAYGTEIDYVIGGTLFCVAAGYLWYLPQRWQRALAPVGGVDAQ